MPVAYPQSKQVQASVDRDDRLDEPSGAVTPKTKDSALASKSAVTPSVASRSEGQRERDWLLTELSDQCPILQWPGSVILDAI